MVELAIAYALAVTEINAIATEGLVLDPAVGDTLKSCDD
jgi:hypothetical protein